MRNSFTLPRCGAIAGTQFEEPLVYGRAGGLQAFMQGIALCVYALFCLLLLLLLGVSVVLSCTRCYTVCGNIANWIFMVMRLLPLVRLSGGASVRLRQVCAVLVIYHSVVYAHGARENSTCARARAHLNNQMVVRLPVGAEYRRALRRRRQHNYYSA